MLQRRDWHDVAAYLLLAAVAMFIALTFRDYGIAWDEPEAQQYGQHVVDRSGGTDADALSFSNMYYYGGLFEATAAWLAERLPLAPYDVRHLLNALVGFLGVVGVWKLGRAVGGPRVGLIAALLLVAAPSYVGHMFFNSKDIPFAAAAAWGLYYTVLILRELPRPRLSLAVRLGVVAGLALGVRVGAVLILVNLAVAVLGWLGQTALQGRGGRGLLNDGARTALRLLPVALVAYPLMLSAWPWAQLDPLVRPLEALHYFAHFPKDIPQNIGGEIYRSTELPWYYLPLFLGIKLPELLVVTGVGAVLFGAWRLGRALWTGGTRAVTRDTTALEWLVLAFAALFPLVYATFSKATLYDEMRHFLFVVPIVAVASAVVVARLIDWAARWRPVVRHAAATLAGIYLTIHVGTVAALHPNEYIYYNAFVGGVDGAEGKYDLDYWNNSLRELSDELNAYAQEIFGKERAQTVPMKVFVCGHVDSIRPYLPAAWTIVWDARSELSFAVDLKRGALLRSSQGSLAMTEPGRARVY
ncbi:MAG: glycosyltransferase family 39 protein [Gammaproteobacteria bacterium]|nr:glycosyltransferase family 39 protein [Gammaproteobacteria bacterium]